MSKRVVLAAVVAVVGVLSLGVAALPSLPAQARGEVPSSLTDTPAKTPADTNVFFEGFENGAGVVNLRDYVGTKNQKYTAADEWLINCNGQIRSMSVPDTDSGNCYVAASDRLGQLAYALGYFVDPNDSTARNNRALTAYTTTADPGANKVELQTDGLVPLSASRGRYLGLSLESAAMNCGDTHPSYDFAFFDEANTRTQVGSGFDPCNAGSGIQVADAAIKVANFSSSGSILFTGSGVGLEIKNENGKAGGNDAAIDNIAIVDMTPMLSSSLSKSAARVNQSVTLTYTVTNPDSASKNGWNFTALLPTGLVVAPTPNAGSTCGSPSVTAAAGASQVIASGDLGAGQASCAISVDVTASAGGSYSVDASKSTRLGLDASGVSSVTFVKNSAISLTKRANVPADIDGDGLTDVGDSVGYSFTVSNDGDSALSGVAVSDPLLSGGVSCVKATLAPKETTTCSSNAPYLVTAADVSAGKVHNSATVSAVDVLGDSVTSVPAFADVLAAAPAPSVGLVKSAQVAAGQSKDGDVVTFGYHVSNTGNVPLSSVSVSETGFSGAGAAPAVSCPATSLAVGAWMDCSASYPVVQADIDAGSVSGTGVVVGVPPKGASVKGSSDASVTLSAAGGLQLTKTSKLDGVGVAGASVQYEFAVVNTGNTTVSDLQVREDAFTGTGTLGAVTCPVLVLAPGESTTCTAGYVLTAADVAAGRVENTATALGSTTQGLVTSTPSVNELRWTPAALAMTGATISLGVLAAALLLILAGAITTTITATRRRREQQ